MIYKAVRNQLWQQTKPHAFCGISSSIFLYSAQDNNVESALSCVETGFFLNRETAGQHLMDTTLSQ